MSGVGARLEGKRYRGRGKLPVGPGWQRHRARWRASGLAGRASARQRTGLRDGGWAGWAVRVEGKGPAGPVQVGLG